MAKNIGSTKGIAYKRSFTGKLASNLDSEDYCAIKKRIDEKREALGIKVSPSKYDARFRTKRRYTIDDVLFGYEVKTKKDMPRSDVGRRIDEAFKAFYESGCTLKLTELSERFQVSDATISNEFNKAGICFQDSPDI